MIERSKRRALLDANRSARGDRRAAARSLSTGAFLLAAFAVSAPARASDAVSAAPAGSAKDARQHVKEAEEHLKRERQELHGALKDGGSAETIKQLDKDVAAAAAELEEARKAARQAERDHLAKKGYSISPTKLRGEWTKHARRVARLQRIRALAVEAKDDATVAKVDQILAKENGRHDHWIDKEHASATGNTTTDGGAK